MITTQPDRCRPESSHTPATVIWSDPLWAHVRSLRHEADILRNLEREADARARDRDADRLVDAIIRGEGDVWVDTAQAEFLTGARPDTIRSWARRAKVRTRKLGGEWRYHRDDLIGQRTEAAR